MENSAIQIKISAVYRSARNVTILRAKGQDLKGSHELAVDGNDAAAITRIAAAILGDASTPDDVFELAVEHGSIQEVK